MNSEEKIFRFLVFHDNYDLINLHKWSNIINLTNIYNFSEKINLPDTLKSLQINNVEKNFKNEMNLPNSLIKLDLGQFNYPINLIKFPDSLKVLKFGDWFNQPITDINLPPNLEFLSFGNHFNEEFGSLKLPESLKVIQFKRYAHHNFPKCNILILDNINCNIEDDDDEEDEFNDKDKFDTDDSNRIHQDTQILCFNNIQYPLLTLPLNIKKIYLPQNDEFKNIMENSKIPFGCEIIYVNVKLDSNNTTYNKHLFEELFGKNSYEIDLYL